MLELKDLNGGYSKGNQIIKDINLIIGNDEVIAVIGQNGAGKSTLVKAILNMIPFVEGNICFNGNSIIGKPTEEIIKNGISIYIQGGRVFPHLNIEENLIFSAAELSRHDLERRKEKVKSYFDMFQKIERNRLGMQASYLSGGEQRQLALAMTLMRHPLFLILDEPSAGLSPANREQLFRITSRIQREEKMGMLLIEQNLNFAVNLCDTVYKMENGRITDSKSSNELKELKNLEKFFWGNNN